jgi:superfamily II DNA or RNA helicase
MILNSGIAPKEFLFVADEVHNAGAKEAQKGLLPIYDKRIGLSATYERHFDDEGTEVLKDYFGGVVYTYDLAQAIHDGYLTPYEYFPHLVRLTEEEHGKYRDISIRISRAIASGSSLGVDVMNRSDVKRLLIMRSKLIKNAANKISELEVLLREMKQKEILNTLIYCDDMAQLEKAQMILNELGIINHKFTQVESLPAREEILGSFARGVYRALVAVKCLDEGVDVPATKTAIIVASTSNPREFIQRRGRVLRKYPGKSIAIVHDFVVLPPASDGNASKAEKAIIEGEFKRVRDFIDTASNKADIYVTFLAAMREFGVYL